MTLVTAIALSGGIDSLVSAALLKTQGHRLIGLHFLTGYEIEARENPAQPNSQTPEIHARQLAEHLSRQLDIPVYIIDLQAPFQNHVVDYFIQAYQEGKTPNPCLVCNPVIKFDALYRQALQMGAQRIATGHYARIKRRQDGRMGLFRGIDTGKDQSYFLARLTEKQLAAAVLPLGEHTKDQTRAMARDMGLAPVSVDESQDVCFIKNTTYSDFIARQPGFKAQPGPIEDIQGHEIGRHDGLHRFTVGQRRGINCPAAAPYYVVRLETRRNCLVVGSRQDLLASVCRVADINWIVPPPREPRRVHVRLRYRHAGAPGMLTPGNSSDTTAVVTFDVPQSAITPGQGAVFYQDDEVLGAGWIQ